MKPLYCWRRRRIGFQNPKEISYRESVSCVFCSFILRQGSACTVKLCFVHPYGGRARRQCWSDVFIMGRGRWLLQALNNLAGEFLSSFVSCRDLKESDFLFSCSFKIPIKLHHRLCTWVAIHVGF